MIYMPRSAIAAVIAIAAFAGCRDSSVDADVRIDFNKDGRYDYEVIREGGLIVQVRQDRNFDGVWDYFEFYEQGMAETGHADDTFDGRIDTWFVWENGTLRLSRHDSDGDGLPDFFTAYRHGIPVMTVVRPSHDMQVLRVEIYRHGILKLEFADLDLQLSAFRLRNDFDHYGALTNAARLDQPVNLADLIPAEFQHEIKIVP